jgi:uncharacterized cupin superfamily protein
MDTKTGRLDAVPPTPSFQSGPGADERTERQLAKSVELSQFGVNHVRLEPGGVSSRRHWHEGEDEFVYVVSGQVELIDENGAHPLGPGDFAGFPAGAANAHHLVNRSDGPAEMIVVGTRKIGEDHIHYPDQADPGPYIVVRDESGSRVSGRWASEE